MQFAPTVSRLDQAPCPGDVACEGWRAVDCKPHSSAPGVPTVPPVCHAAPCQFPRRGVQQVQERRILSTRPPALKISPGSPVRLSRPLCVSHSRLRPQGFCRTPDSYRECQKVWGSAGFVRIYGHMIHRRPTDTAVAIGCLYRDRREGYRHGGRQAVRKRQQCPPRTVDRAGHSRPRHALPDCSTLFGTLRGQNNATGRARSCTGALPPLMHGLSCIISIP